MFQEQDTNKHFRLCQCDWTGNAPTVIFSSKHFNQKLSEGEVIGILYGMFDNGWMDQELFSSS